MYAKHDPYPIKQNYTARPDPRKFLNFRTCIFLYTSLELKDNIVGQIGTS